MFEDVLQCMIQTAREASAEVLRIYKKGFSVNSKEDKSPVTDADLASNRIIRDMLSVFNDFGWLSEEDVDNEDRLLKRNVFVVDPLDGTQDFVNKNGSFGINIALVSDGIPVAAVVAVPVESSYAFALKGKGSFYVDSNGNTSQMHVSDRTDSLRVLISKSHLIKSEQDVLDKYRNRISEIIELGASLKAIALARGDAEVSIRFTSKTKEWDICAPELIVTEAGGIFEDTKKNKFRYNKSDVHNHNGYCMFNRKENEFLLC